MTTPYPGADAGFGVQGVQNMWFSMFGFPAGFESSSFTVQSVPSQSGVGTTMAAVLSWQEGTGGNSWFGFSQGYHYSVASPANALNELTFSFDVNLSGDDLAGAKQPITIWFTQWHDLGYGPTMTYEASISPDCTLDPRENGWDHVSFTLDNVVLRAPSGPYDPFLGFQISFDSGDGVVMNAGAVGTIGFDNISLDAQSVPEPTQAAASTLLLGCGGLIYAGRRLFKRQAK